MTATQGRLADTIDVFYTAADKASESAMAAHAYKRAVDDLDTGLGRELVRLVPPPRFLSSLFFLPADGLLITRRPCCFPMCRRCRTARR